MNLMSGKACLSYWFPKLQAAGLPVPRTEIVRTGADLSPLLDGNLPEGWGAFLAELNVAIERVGGQPCFLRTGQGSGKHQWERTCYLDLSKGTLPNHVAALVEWSALVDFFGLPTDVWAVRELLPTRPIATLPRYGNMPLVPEVRAFVGEGRCLCHHDYWPLGAIREGLDADGTEEAEAERLCWESAVIGDDLWQALQLAERVAKAFAGDGSWSVDLLPTERGWYVTDMAPAAMSYHEPSCPCVKGGES